MTVDPGLTRAVFEESFDLFVAKERKMLLENISERSSCSRFAKYLELNAEKQGLEGYYADTEYNRGQGGTVKVILDDELKTIQITCDVLLHSRGEIQPDDNLIAIEMKKSKHPPEEKQKDRDRLRALTKPFGSHLMLPDGTPIPEYVCGYKLGVYVEINLGERTLFLEYYSEGEKVEEREQTF